METAQNQLLALDFGDRTMLHTFLIFCWNENLNKNARSFIFRGVLNIIVTEFLRARAGISCRIMETLMS
jgi:hypothetical protein